MCGVFGIRAPGDATSPGSPTSGCTPCSTGGRRAPGSRSRTDGRVTALREMGLVAQVFDESKLRALVGEAAIGHTRYSTTGSATWQNSQPIVRHVRGRHRSRSATTATSRTRPSCATSCSSAACDLDSTSDTEVIGALIAEHPGEPARGLDRGDVAHRGAFAAVLLAPERR